MVLVSGNPAGQTYEQDPQAMQSFAQSFSAFSKLPLFIAS
jgi:hypothetical protein